MQYHAGHDATYLVEEVDYISAIWEMVSQGTWNTRVLHELAAHVGQVRATACERNAPISTSRLTQLTRLLNSAAEHDAPLSAQQRDAIDDALAALRASLDATMLRSSAASER